MERTGGWCWRNPLTAGLATAVVVALLLGSTVATAFGFQANAKANDEKARQHTELEKERADVNAVLAAA